jgi:hypothetical protein
MPIKPNTVPIEPTTIHDAIKPVLSAPCFWSSPGSTLRGTDVETVELKRTNPALSVLGQQRQPVIRKLKKVSVLPARLFMY